jgi:hypothetical protein
LYSLFFIFDDTMTKGGEPEKKQASLCSDNVTGRGGHSWEIKHRESESEGHLALRKC